MKIAYCFSGMMRHLDKCGPKWQEIIKNNPGDVYGHFWEKSDKSEDDTIEKFIEFFNPKKIELENFEIFKESTIDCLIKNVIPSIDLRWELQQSILSGNFFSFQYKIWKANQLSLIDNYDVVVRCRTDSYPQTDILIEKNDYLNLPVGSVYVPGWANSSGNIDLFAYGNRKIMNYYSCVYPYIMKYLFEGYYSYPYEYILSVHLSHRDINIRELPISIIDSKEYHYNWWAGKKESIYSTTKMPLGDKMYYSYTENRIL